MAEGTGIGTVLLKTPEFEITAALSTSPDLKGTQVLLTLVGVINERVDLNVALAKLTENFPKAKQVALDTCAINRINSVGLRSWLLFVDAMTAKYQLRHEILGETLASQFAVEPKVLGAPKTAVKTLILPFSCPVCAHRTTIASTCEVLTSTDTGFTLPQVVCESCGEPMIFDALEQDYLDILNYVG